MQVLFCKISHMAYYKGHCDSDMPINGGQYVKETGFGHEEFNFLPVSLDEESEKVCLGFVEPKSNRGNRNSLHIEKIEGCAAMKKAPFIEDVLVIWCATRDPNRTRVVGWYQHATVWRNLRETTVKQMGSEQERCYNVQAKASDCVLIPETARNPIQWNVPLAKKKGYGFGQSMVWYPTEDEAKTYLNKIIDIINDYHGKNDLYAFPTDESLP